MAHSQAAGGPHPPACPTDRHHATVHSLFGRRSEPPAHHASRPPSPAEQQLAETFQAVFRSRGHSLADPETAEIYRTSLQVARIIVEGATKGGQLEAAQRDALLGMLDHADRSPDYL